MKLVKYLLLLVAATVINIAPVMAAEAVKTEGLKVGTPAPNIFGRKLDDSPFILHKEITGPMVLSFFWVKCVPCKKELPEMAAMEKKYPKLKFIAVHADAGYGKEIPEFLTEIVNHPEMVVVADKSITDRYSFKGFPHTVVISADKKIMFVISGYNEDNMTRLENFIKKIQ
jgi:thiol-disulfide isomerase/thioredoxin